MYIFKIQENTWIKLNPIGDIPPARAAHSACALNNNHLAIFGGTCLQGELAPDDLYVLEVSSEKNSSIWYKVPHDGSGPGKRYGHSLIYYKNYFYSIIKIIMNFYLFNNKIINKHGKEIKIKFS